MILKFLEKYGAATFTLATLFLLTSCGEATQVTSTATPEPTPLPTSTPFPEIELNTELPEGDPEKGYLTAVKRGCFGCHADEKHPEKAIRFIAFDDLPNIFERGEIRIADPNYEGRATTNWEYVIESIRQPEIYLAPGDWEKPMPVPSIYNQITDEELTDIIAWMRTLE